MGFTHHGLMNKLWHGIASPNLATHSTSVLAGWPGSVFLGLALFFAYMINGRDLGTYDTISASLLPLYILRGDGIYFDNEHLGQRGIELADPRLLDDLAWSRRDAVSDRAGPRRRALLCAAGRLAGSISSGVGPRSPGGTR